MYSCSVFLVVFATFEVSGRSVQDQIDNYSRAINIFTLYTEVYVSHPEVSRVLDTLMSDQQRELLVQVSKEFFYCTLLNKKDKDECVEKFMKKYDGKIIDDLLDNKLVEVDQRVCRVKPSAHECRNVVRQYNDVIQFFGKIIFQNKNFEETKELLDKFNNDERKLAETLFKKAFHYIFHRADFDAFVDMYAFFKDNETFWSVYKKYEEFKKK